MNKKELIKKTFDMRNYKNQLLAMSVLTIAGILVFIAGIFTKEENPILISSAFILFLLVPSTVYYAYKIKSILADPEKYELLEATAIKAHRTFGNKKSMVYFDLEVKDEKGEAFYLETNRVFSNNLLNDTYYKDYEGGRFRILYDRTTSTVLVINDF